MIYSIKYKNNIEKKYSIFTDLNNLKVTSNDNKLIIKEPNNEKLIIEKINENEYRVHDAYFKNSYIIVNNDVYNKLQQIGEALKAYSSNPAAKLQMPSGYTAAGPRKVHKTRKVRKSRKSRKIRKGRKSRRN